MDFHQTMESLNESFLTFINKIPFYGLAVLCIDDANVRGLLPKVQKALRDLRLVAGGRFFRTRFANDDRGASNSPRCIMASRWASAFALARPS